MHQRRFHLFGLPVDPYTQQELIEEVTAAVARRRRLVVANLNLHGLYCGLTCPEMEALLRQRDSIVHIDGVPIVWLGKIWGNSVTRASRLAHLDLLPHLLQALASVNARIFFIGGKPDVAQKGRAALASRIPDLNMEVAPGFFSFGADDEEEALERIAAAKPDVLLIGMGMPRQEMWVSRIQAMVDAPVIMVCGGFLDYIAGETATPPRWLGPLGLEWAFRLMRDPRRLGSRYCIEPFKLIAIICRRLLGDVTHAR